MSKEQDEPQVSDIVWASAKRSIFWPAQVIEVNGAFLTVHFYGENTVETIKNPNKILPFCHPAHEQFIHIGRKQHNIDKKLQFNKGLAAADKDMKSRKDKTQVPLRRSPRKLTQSASVGHVISCLGTSKASEGSARGITKVKSNRKGMKLQSLVKRTLLNKGSVTDSQEMAATRRSPRKKAKSAEEIVEESPQEQSFTSRKRGRPGTEEGVTKDGKTTRSKKHQTGEQMQSTKANVDQNREQSSSKVSPLRGRKTNRNNKKKAKSNSSGEKNTERDEVANRGKVMKLNLEYIPDTEVAQVSSGQCACLYGKTANTEKKTGNNSCHKDKVGKSSSWKNSACVGTRTVEGTKLDRPHSCQDQEDKEMAENKDPDKEKEFTTRPDSPPISDSSSDDDDLPEAFSLSQEPCSPGAFALHDIVWAKYKRDPFWPAQILKISRKKKLKKYYVKFLCDPCNHLIHVQEKNLFLFSSNRRETFLEASTARPNFFEAVTMAEDLVNRKGLGKSFEEEHEVDDFELVENASDQEETDEQQDKGDVEAPDSPVVIRRSSRERIQVSRYSDILTYVREALPTLKSIYEGKRSSSRHQTYIHGREREREKLKLRAGFGPIGNSHLQDQIMELLLSFHQEVTKEKQFSAIKYVADVWLPEAIIFAIQRKDGVDRVRAEDMYLTGSLVAVSQADVEQFTHNLKEKTLTDEDREACLRRAERALARETGAVL